ncbi:unnamed protein product [Lota lota]
MEQGIVPSSFVKKESTGDGFSARRSPPAHMGAWKPQETSGSQEALKLSPRISCTDKYPGPPTCQANHPALVPLFQHCCRPDLENRTLD